MTTLTPARFLLCIAGAIIFAGFSFSLGCLAHFLGYIQVPLLSLGRSPNAGFLQPFFAWPMVLVFVLSLMVWTSCRWLALLGLVACALWFGLASLPVA